MLELVEGPTLADRISRGPIPLDEALPIAKQIAEALEAAHEAGVIHRDLKPANIKVREDGTVKVLDFGLAKALDPTPTSDPSDSPTLTAAATQMGVIMGTAAYMAPEQASGKVVDKRADVWAFGVVLFEMLTGVRPFASDDVSKTLAHVIAIDPDWTALPKTVPPVLGTFLRGCLEKNPKQRVQAIGDVRPAMEGSFDAAASAWPPDQVAPPSNPRRLAVAVLTALTVGVVLGWVVRSPGVEPAPVSYFDLTIDPADQLGDTGGSRLETQILSRTAIALAPDGRRLVFAGWRDGEQRLYSRFLDRQTADPIPGTEGGMNPFFSPGGEWVGFWAAGRLQKVALAGGLPVPLCDTDAIYGASWVTDDKIVFGQQSGGLLQVSAQGGACEVLTETGRQGGLSHRLPWVLPGGEAVLFTVWNSSRRRWSEAEVVVESLVTGDRRVLVEGGANPIYAPSGHLLYVRLGVLWAAPFDVTTLELTGRGVPVLEEITQAAEISNVFHNTGAAQLSLSASGELVYVPGGLVLPDLRRLVWVDREGQSEPVDMPLGEYWWPRFSPDGERFAVADAGDNTVIVFDRRRNLAQRLPGNGFSVGAWTPDGSRIFLSAADNRSARNLFWQLADGSGPPERLTSSPNVQFPGSSRRDGELVFIEIHPDNGEDVLVLDPHEPETTEKRLLGESFDEEYPALSPDGRWLAYASNESGETEVFVVAYPDLEGKYPISDGAGYMPTWSSDGREIYYLRPPFVVVEDTPLMAVSVSTDAGFRAESPRELFRFRHHGSNAARTYDVAPDGRFLMVESGTGPRSRAVTTPRLIINFLSELERLVPID